MKAADYPVVWSDAAEADLEAIVDYMTQHRGRDDALALLGTIVERVDTFGAFPPRGPVPKELEDTGEKRVRQSVLGRFRILYEVGDDRIAVFLVADGRRDMQALLRQRLLSPSDHA